MYVHVYQYLTIYIEGFTQSIICFQILKVKMQIYIGKMAKQTWYQTIIYDKKRSRHDLSSSVNTLTINGRFAVSTVLISSKYAFAYTFQNSSSKFTLARWENRQDGLW